MSQMISVAAGFQYSVNIGYDLHNDNKLQNFIPTTSSLNLLQDILQSTDESATDRARVLVGAYGKGKSHIVLTILSVLMRKDWALFTKLAERVAQNPVLEQQVKNYYDSNKKILPVVINGSNTSVQQAFLIALQKTLSENDLLKALPDTNYQAAVRVINKWKIDFPDTYEKFKEEIGQPIENFLSELENYNSEAYMEFEKIYPNLTAGSTFNPFIGFDVVELYESVVKALKSEGYNGMFVVYDEFSKFLETNIKGASVSDTKMLQDFAEKCNRSGNHQIHLMLISHKEISNYIDELPKQKVDGWRGVSERFKHIHLNNNFTQTYEIISSVIRKNNEHWESFLDQYNESFQSVFNRYATHAVFADMEHNICQNTLMGCYPLHPVSIFVLPRLSERVAQNERTLFTFLSAHGNSTLPSFLEQYNDDCYKLITPDIIFDYFEPLFRKESYSSDLHKNYILAKMILENLEPDSLETKIIKAISLIYTLEQFDKIKPTINELDGIYSIDYSHEDIRAAIDNLIHKEYVIYLKLSNEFLQLKQSSGIDVKQKIADTIELKGSSFSVKDTLNNASLDNYMYPSRYNDEREMTRFFAFRFIDGAEVNENVDWKVKSEGIDADGVVYGIITENEESLEIIKTALLNTSQNQKRMVFILPKKHTEIRNVVMQFNAVTTLRDAAIADEILFDEYEVIYEDLREVISDFINTYTHPENYKSCYIYDGTEKNIFRKAALTALLSDICNDVYSMTPIINNEVINKNELSSVAYGSRNKIIAALLRNVIEHNLGFSGTGQEVSIMRSTLVRTNILVNDGNSTSINLHTEDTNLDNMLNVICDFVRKGRTQEECKFDDLYYDLTSPAKGIGLRKSLIPIYIAAVLHEYKRDIVIMGDYGQAPVNMDTLLQIEASPKRFRLKYLDWDPTKVEFLTRLENVFSDYINEAEKNANSYEYIISAMNRWYMSLPKWSKEKNPQRVAKKYKGLIKLLRQNCGSYELLFEKLPREFGPSLSPSELANDINLAKVYYDKALDKLINSLICYVKELFSSNTGRETHERSSLYSIVKDWCEELDPSVFEQLFDNGADRCLGLMKEVTNDERTFIIRLAKLITDLRIEDWNEELLEQFKNKLVEYKETAENFKGHDDMPLSESTNEYTLTFIDNEGKNVTKRFDRVKESRAGRLLTNAILENLESMGRAISENEKRQILMEILKKFC